MLIAWAKYSHCILSLTSRSQQPMPKGIIIYFIKAANRVDMSKIILRGEKLMPLAYNPDFTVPFYVGLTYLSHSCFLHIVRSCISYSNVWATPKSFKKIKLCHLSNRSWLNSALVEFSEQTKMIWYSGWQKIYSTYYFA